MRSTRQAEPQKKNRLGLPECVLSCFIKRSLAQLFFFAHHSLRCGESVCHAHHSKTGELRSLLAAVTARMDKTSGRRTGVSDGRRDGDVDGWCRGTWEVVALSGEELEGRGGWTSRQGGGCVSPLCEKYRCVTDHLRRRLCVVPRGCPV